MIAINVSQLLKLEPGSTRKLSFSDPLGEAAAELGLVGPVSGHATLLRTARGIVVACTYRTDAELPCARCLEPSRLEIDGEFGEEFQPRVDVLTGHTLADQPESEELAIDDHHILDLTEVIRQDILTRLPLRPLCRPDCPGLCSECGRELVVGSCGCQASSEARSPFSRLRELFPPEETAAAVPGREEG